MATIVPEAKHRFSARRPVTSFKALAQIVSALIAVGTIAIIFVWTWGEGGFREIPLIKDTTGAYLSFTGLTQRWSVFATPKNLSRDGWFVIQGTLSNGSDVDIMRNLSPVDWSKPPLSGRRRLSNATPRWPIFIWLMQLVPSFTLLGVGFARAQSSGVALDPMKTKLAIGLGVVWTATALGFALRPATRHWLIDRRRQWLTAAASAFLATVMVDIGLTVTGTVPTITEQQNRSVSYALGWFTRLRMTTQDVARDDGRLLHINRRGFRGQEIDVERRLGRKRVVVLGGSQVFDLIGNWPYQVQGLLLGEGINAEVINAGVSGHDTTDSLGKFLTDLWTLKTRAGCLVPDLERYEIHIANKC